MRAAGRVEEWKDGRASLPVRGATELVVKSVVQ